MKHTSRTTVYPKEYPSAISDWPGRSRGPRHRHTDLQSLHSVTIEWWSIHKMQRRTWVTCPAVAGWVLLVSPSVGRRDIISSCLWSSLIDFSASSIRKRHSKTFFKKCTWFSALSLFVQHRNSSLQDSWRHLFQLIIPYPTDHGNCWLLISLMTSLPCGIFPSTQ